LALPVRFSRAAAEGTWLLVVAPLLLPLALPLATGVTAAGDGAGACCCWPPGASCFVVQGGSVNQSRRSKRPRITCIRTTDLDSIGKRRADDGLDPSCPIAAWVLYPWWPL
jgi:hypothetical protein